MKALYHVARHVMIFRLLTDFVTVMYNLVVHSTKFELISFGVNICIFMQHLGFRLMKQCPLVEKIIQFKSWNMTSY